MYFHNSLIPRSAYFLLPLESKQEAKWGWNFTKYISEVKVNQLKVKNIHVEMGISIFKMHALFFEKVLIILRSSTKHANFKLVVQYPLKEWIFTLKSNIFILKEWLWSHWIHLKFNNHKKKSLEKEWLHAESSHPLKSEKEMSLFSSENSLFIRVKFHSYLETRKSFELFTLLH